MLDRTGVAAGSSWGNAGWLTPGMAMPIADPSLWAMAPKALLDPDAPIHVPFRVDPALWTFLARFMGHGTQRAWDRTMAALTPIDRLALDAFDELRDGGVQATTHAGPFVVAFERADQAPALIHELEHVARHGQTVPVSEVTDRSTVAPYLSEKITTVYRLDGQRYLEPGPFLQSLAKAFVDAGGTLRSGATVAEVTADSGPRVRLTDGEVLSADTVVLAAGAWLSPLARRFGVRTPVMAGRGYSFSVATEHPVTTPVYFPARRVACTPYEGRLRVAGTMEFRRPDEPLHRRRIDAIVRSVTGLIDGVDLQDRQDEWVGSRPLTPDGLPLIGKTAAPGIFVAGGHGMWGVVLGPATGRLIAEQIVTGDVPDELAPFDPLR